MNLFVVLERKGKVGDGFELTHGFVIGIGIGKGKLTSCKVSHKHDGTIVPTLLKEKILFLFL